MMIFLSMCSDCGCFVKRKNMYRKVYKHTGICLCSACAKDLAEEITNRYAVKSKEIVNEKV